MPGACHAGLEWHREKQLKHAVLRSIAELVYYYSTGGDAQFGSWFSRKRASIARAVSRCSRSSSSRLLRKPSPNMGAESSLSSVASSSSAPPETEDEALTRTSNFGSDRSSARSSDAASDPESPASSPRMCGVCSPRPSALASSSMQPGAAAMSLSTVRKSICASLTGRRRGAPPPTSAATASSAAGLPGEHLASVHTRPMRRMRLRDQLELTKEMTNDTVIYLSPHYRQLAASGVLDPDDIRQNMYNEISTQFGALGITVTSDTAAAFSGDQRSLMLLVLCPGFFTCSELVEETAQALRYMHKQGMLNRRAGAEGSSGRSHQPSVDEGAGSSCQASGDGSADSSIQLEGGMFQRYESISKRQDSMISAGVGELSRRFKRRPKALVALMSTAMPLEDYFQSCPPDLKELGLFEATFEKWPESRWLQPTAVATLIHRLPGHHHATRYQRTSDLLHRLGGRSRKKAGMVNPAVRLHWDAVSEERERRATAADLGGRQLVSGDFGASGRLSVRCSAWNHRASRNPPAGSSSHTHDELDRPPGVITDEERFRKDREAYRAIREAGGGSASPATLPRLPSLPTSRRGPKASRATPALSSSVSKALSPSEPLSDEQGAAIPLARPSSLPMAPPDTHLSGEPSKAPEPSMMNKEKTPFYARAQNQVAKSSRSPEREQALALARRIIDENNRNISGAHATQADLSSGEPSSAPWCGSGREDEPGSTSEEDAALTPRTRLARAMSGEI